MTIRKDDILENVQRQFACNHENTEIRKKADKNGRVLLVRQCQRCGQRYGNFLSHEAFSTNEIDTFEPWDSALEVNHGKNFSETMIRMHAEEKARLKAEFLSRHDAYLKSEVWKKLRQKVLKRSDHICEGCGDAPATQVHHMNYARWGGNELLIDLLAVCADCHQKLHPKDRSIVDILIDSRNLPENNRGTFFETEVKGD